MLKILQKNKLLSYAIALILSIILIGLTFVFHDKLVGLKSLGLLGIFLINFFSTVALFLPNFSAVSVVAGGNLYNPILVAIVATLGGVLGDVSSFVIGRSGTELLASKEGKLFNKFSTLFLKYGFIIVFLLALVPNPIFDAIGIFAGATRYSFKKYFIAMLLGRIIRNLGLAFLGKSL